MPVAVRRARWPLRLVLAALLALGGVALAAGTASAHAVLRSTTPGSGAVLSTAPEQVVLTFDDVVSNPFITVTGPSGRLDAGPAAVSGTSASVALRPGAGSGGYTVAYRVVSDDGHPVEGTFAYRLQLAASASPSSPHSSPPSASAGGTASGARNAARSSTALGGAGTRTNSDGHGGHWVSGIAGAVLLVAGAGALLWERRQRNRAAAPAPAESDRPAVRSP